MEIDSKYTRTHDRSSGSLSILGGGIAGLAAGYYAKKRGMRFTVYEADSRAGGNCVTFRNGDFFYDSGAHRLHDKDPETTAVFTQLIGEDLQRVEAPSHIFFEGKFIRFPLAAGDLFRAFGPLSVVRAGLEVISGRVFTSDKEENFERFATSTYGRTIAGHFLLNYSEKLWGVPCSRLSPVISGKRLNGLDLRGFIARTITGQTKNPTHMEGAFYYPKHGIGMLAESLANNCGSDTIRINSGITRIFHDHRGIRAFEVNGSENIHTDRVVATIPIDLFVRLLEPAPPHEIAESVSKLRFRNLILAALFLDRESVSDDATVYFPSKEFPFTRVYEPRNRSRNLSPPGKTSLVAEIPCQEEDALWMSDDRVIADRTAELLINAGWFAKEEVLGTEVRRLRNAYPVLEVGFEKHVQKVFSYLSSFRNLQLSGRNGKFCYSWIHDMMRFGREAVSAFE